MSKTKKILFYVVSVVTFLIPAFVLLCIGGKTQGAYFGLFEGILYPGLGIFLWLDHKGKFE